KEVKLTMLHKCHYIVINCPCAAPGFELREAISSLPKTATVLCPVCRKRRPFTVLCPGMTNRILPFHEIYRLSSSSAAIDAEGQRKIPWGGNGV
ncbi:MAG TPA: hypothetical protein VKZ53_24860, partial [Candidatus Angelobacter sp.]|nr:hypothetical protein [Candidatus Angelobacter sp.]